MKNNIIKSENDIEIYENDIYILCDEFIENMDDPNKLYNNKNSITAMLKYCYKQKIQYILNNNNFKHRPTYNDVNLLMDLWNIYTSIIYKYSDNMKPNILGYCLFTGISNDNIYEWGNGKTKNLTPEFSDFVKTIRSESEMALINGSSVFDIFLLKSMFAYNDNLAAVPIENQARINADNLPILSLHNSSDNDILTIEDVKKQPVES